MFISSRRTALLLALWLPLAVSAESLTIAEIHGDQLRPTRLGEQVTTKGIVTLTHLEGFWLQSTASAAPSQARDGLYVFTGEVPTVGAGDIVEITAKVAVDRPLQRERDLALTRLVEPSEIVVLRRDAALPPARSLAAKATTVPDRLFDDDPTIDPTQSTIDYWAHHLGTRVCIDTPLVIGPPNRWGDIWVVPKASDPALNQLGVLVGNRENDHPNRMLVSQHPLLVNPAINRVVVGDTLAPIDGVVHYERGQFRVIPRHALSTALQATRGANEPVATRLVASDEHLTVAAYNVENLNAIVERLNRVNGPRDVDDAVGSGRMARLGEHIARFLSSPDIVALQEIQDNNGAELGEVVAADRSYAVLVDAIVAAGGPRYSVIDLPPALPDAEGGQPGGNIRNGYLYLPQRVQLLAPGGEKFAHEAFAGARQPVIAGFSFNGHEVWLVNNHFTSKWGSSPRLGVPPQFIAGVAERRAQSLAVRDLLRGRGAWRDEANWIVLGDFNDHWFSPALSALQGDDDEPLVSLTETLRPKDRWTYIFEGVGQAIDHIVVTPQLAAQAEYEVVHVNARFAEQAADHEPIVARFHLPTTD